RTLARYQLVLRTRSCSYLSSHKSRQLAPATDHEAHLGDEKGNKVMKVLATCTPVISWEPIDRRSMSDLERRTQAWRGRVGKHRKHCM
ncbi:hypothetical protein QBC32DRAFT_204122, partial [Pseudoneurospora amorphoporcata]